MRINAVRFFLILSFIVAQFFTQQLHELTHLISQTDCEPQVQAQHSEHSVTGAHTGANTLAAPEKHEHCKFLQLIANQHAQPFLTLNSGTPFHTLYFKNTKPAILHNWISYSDSNYHQARAPPAI